MPDPRAEPSSQPYDPIASEDDVRHCFRLLLGRNPYPYEWVGQQSNIGRPLALVVANMLNSMEFAERGLLTPRAAPVELAQCDGYKIYGSPQDEAVGRHALACLYEPNVTSVVRRALRRGMGMIDIGANIGVFALLAAARVGASGYVLAVEPNPANARLIEASRLLNGFDHLIVCQAAAGREIGMLGLHSSDSNGTTSPLGAEALLQDAQTVPAMPIDSLVSARQHIDVIKIDVEGAEYLALQGCETILRRWQPFLVSEFSPGLLESISGIAPVDYLHWLLDLDYRIGVIDREGKVSPPGADPALIMAHYRASGVDHIDLACLPPDMPPSVLA
jgi:FkbM family methyltransferase